MYVSGSPGLGKSLTIRQAYDRLAATLPPQHKLGFLNAFHLASPSAVYAAMLQIIQGDAAAGSASADGSSSPTARRPEGDAKALFEAMALGRGGAKADAPLQLQSSTAATKCGRGHSRGGGGGGKARAKPTEGAAAAGGGAEGAPPMYIIVLDELDQLLNRQSEVLYGLFQLAASATSRIVLIGVANALDLTDRFLPKLAARGARAQDEPKRVRVERARQARGAGAACPACPRATGTRARAHTCRLGRSRARAALMDDAPVRAARTGATPRTLKFAPYSERELASIILQRVQPSEAGTATQLLERAAVTYCAKKVAASSGDARRALEVCRVATDRALLELTQLRCDRLEARGSTAAAPEGGGAASPSTAAASALPSWAAKPPVRFEHMATALSSAFKSVTLGLLAALPQHQQLLLCALVQRMRRLHKAETTAAEAASKAAEAATAAAEAARGGGGADGGGADASDGDRLAAEADGAHERAKAAAAAAAAKRKAATTLAARAAVGGGGSERCTINCLATEYMRLCASERIPALRPAEILPLCESLAVCGLLAIGGGGGGSGGGQSLTRRKVDVADPLGRAVWLCISAEDLKMATEQLSVFKNILAASSGAHRRPPP